MTTYARDSRLIFDLGMNNGDDTDYYLKLGYDVVALEANPALCARASERFADAVEQGRLTIVHAAIWEHSGKTSFLVNLDNDHWSSIDPDWAGRDDSTCERITVQCVTLPELFARFGVPYNDMVEHYATTVRDREGNRLAPRTRWWDIHCTRLT